MLHDTADRCKVYDMLLEEEPKATAQANLSWEQMRQHNGWRLESLLEGDKITLDGADTAHQELMSVLRVQPTDNKNCINTEQQHTIQ